MVEKLLLNQARHADSDTSNTTLQVELPGDKEVIVDGAFNDTVNQYGVYLDEREACNKVRLTATVNMVASNIVFNTVTEIVKNEGSSDCTCLNYDPTKISSSIGKNPSWGSDINYAVIDTQISYDGESDKNYTYNCGIDIFNNPILRSNTYISQWLYEGSDQDSYDFNTFDEFVCDEYKSVLAPVSMFTKADKEFQMHQYRHNKSNTMSFFDSLDRNMVDNNGWIGFYNKSQAKTVSGNTNGYGTDRVLNNESPGKFIDLFPGRDRYSLIPRYNSYRRRFENNWEHCLTYPSSSTTENMPFINQRLDTLRIGFIDETEKDDDGVYRCTMYAMVKHGLVEGDTINLYKSSEDGMQDELVEGDIVIDTVIDDYTFTVYTSDWVCKKWVSVFDTGQCEYYGIQHIIGNQYLVNNSKMKLMSDDYNYQFTGVTAQWRYVAEDDTSYNYPYGNDSNSWHELPEDYDKHIEYSVNNYLNVDYDRYGGVKGYKYFPYNRFARVLRDLYIDMPESAYTEIYEYFLSNAEDFKITATLGQNNTWTPDQDCLDRALESIERCSILSEIKYEEGGVVHDDAMRTLKSMVSAYTKNDQSLVIERYRSHYSGTSFTFVSKKEIYTSQRPLVDSITFGYNYWDEDTSEEKITDIGSKNLSFAKTVDGIQCEYYTRLFSRLPNFDFYEGELTVDNIYSGVTGSRPVDTYSQLEYERQSTVTKLGFAKNAYGDTMAQIVYNDDIDISLLKDNLGRPLTSLWLTFFKTNYGYREWYQKTNTPSELPDYKNEKAEWSRCFGKLNCGFEYSPHFNQAYNLSNTNTYANARVMNNVDGIMGLDETPLGGGWKSHPDASQYIDDDELFYKEQNLFYGDLCEYSPAECIEQSIQWPLHRFNTAQRELKGRSKTPFAYEKFKTVTYSEVGLTYISVGGGYRNTMTYDYDPDPAQKPEGQLYQPYHEIPVRTFSQTLSEFYPDLIGISSISIEPEQSEDGVVCTIAAVKSTYYNQGAVPCLYDTETKVSYRCNLINVPDLNEVKLKVYGIGEIDADNPGRYRVFAMRKDIPSYAQPIEGVDSAYRWRYIVQNGFETTEGVIEEYPFVNGCLYINKDINLFVRRQDPFGENGLASVTKYFGIPSVTGERNPVESGTSPNANDAISEAAAIC